MLGERISDTDCVEGGGSIRGMELLPITTLLCNDKERCQTTGVINKLTGTLEALSGCPFEGYALHMGRTVRCGGKEGQKEDGMPIVFGDGKNIYGSYVHGLFDRKDAALAVAGALAERKGIKLSDEKISDYRFFKEKQYDKLADTLRVYLDMEKLYGTLGEAHLE